MNKNRNVNIITDADGKKLVLINNIHFKAKARDDWNIVEEYLKGYIGKFYEIEENSDIIFISQVCWSVMRMIIRSIYMIYWQ